ncbi:hypothetical protein A6V39_00635 [Candidatus Mycoplasma haematobovis]|uniref:Uncharacterized protein n=1 Tax=Candidatus Mycoplasma haematobovis TaxID=432608 RepID=A0A1A9QDK5_9MOLU|nr:hypothetical protein [Candidatus Mycoplasma haematobovis]OAL10557.1 hypothetical protein A6V39_00635 [Candidatus Mycoplasma haematobovis]
MTLIGKSIATTAVVGTIGGVGAYAGGLFNINSDSDKAQKVDPPKEVVFISSRLTDEGYELLDTEKAGSAGWDVVLSAYRKAQTKTFSGSPEVSTEESGLRNKCRVALKKDDDKNYLLARQWCVKETTVNKILEKTHKLLNATQVVEGEAEKWNKKFEDLKQATDEFKELREKMKATSANVETLKAECKELTTPEVKTTEEKFNTVLTQVKEWCAVTK